MRAIKGGGGAGVQSKERSGFREISSVTHCITLIAKNLYQYFLANSIYLLKWHIKKEGLKGPEPLT